MFLLTDRQGRAGGDWHAHTGRHTHIGDSWIEHVKALFTTKDSLVKKKGSHTRGSRPTFTKRASERAQHISAPMATAAAKAEYRAIVQSSRCPSDSWHDAVTHLIMHTSQPLRMINVGANKGYGVQPFLLRYARGEKINGRTWAAALRTVGKELTGQRVWKPCGACNDCRAPAPRELHSATVQVHAFELLGTNVRLLRKVIEHFGLSDVVRVHHAAVAHEAGAFREPLRNTDRRTTGPELAAGDERWSPLVPWHNIMNRSAPVASTTLDTFAASQPGRLRNITMNITLLKVDTEGWDALVLEGAAALLRDRAVELLEFEFNPVGAWDHASRALGPKRRLPAVVEGLRANGYSCFFEGGDGRLAPCSSRPWQARELERTNEWSNLLCAHRATVVSTLETLVPSALR